MTLTVFPPSTPTPFTKSPISPASTDADLTLLTITRLFARLEYNLLSSTADLRPLVRDELQRIRVHAVWFFSIPPGSGLHCNAVIIDDDWVLM